MIPERTQVGNLVVVHTPMVHHIVVHKPGILVSEIVHEITYDSITEAEEKQAEAIAWAKAHAE